MKSSKTTENVSKPPKMVDIDKTWKSEKPEVFLGMTLEELFHFTFETAIIGGTFYAASVDEENAHALVWLIFDCIRLAGGCAFFHMLWHQFDVHKKFGIWKTTEPESHYHFTMETMWIVALYAMGKYATEKVLGMYGDATYFYTTFQLTEEQLGKKLAGMLRVEQPERTFVEDLYMAFFIFYVLDFFRYWGHRIGHMQPVWYRTFPWAHAHHHNQVFMSPLINFMSPFLHFAALGTYIPCGIFYALGYMRAAKWAWVAQLGPTLLQHAGCDPLPWLSRINHRYFYGALPWINLYHAYHHLHIVKSGNFGNTTVFWDYVFGTVTPECVYHIEHGEAHPRIQKFFEDPTGDKLERHFVKNLYGGRKNRIDLN